MQGEKVEFDEAAKPVKAGRPTKNKGGRPRKQHPVVPVTPFENQSNQGLQARVEKILESRRSPVDIEELAMEFHARLGGSRGFADAVISAFDAAPKGSPEQARLLDAFLKLFEKAGQRNTLTDLDAISEQDLDNLIQSKMQDMGFSREAVMQAIGRRVEILEYPDHVCI